MSVRKRSYTQDLKKVAVAYENLRKRVKTVTADLLSNIQQCEEGRDYYIVSTSVSQQLDIEGMFEDLMSEDILKEMTECINEAIEARDELSQKLKQLLSQKPLVMACRPCF